MVSLLALIVVLGVLIFVHELGHYIAAKSVGIGVPRFSIGLGPLTPLKFTWRETEFVVSWIPFGGYVKMASREELEAYQQLEGGETPYDYPPEKMFEAQPLWARIVVILAGVTMNVVFAWVVYVGLALGYGDREDVNTSVARFVADSLPPGAEVLAEVPFGSEITAINGRTVTTYRGIFDALVESPGRDITFSFVAHPDVTVEASEYSTQERVEIFTSYIPVLVPRIAEVDPDSPADVGGLEPMDVVVRVNGDSVREWGDLLNVVSASAGTELALDVRRGDSLVSLFVTPEARDVAMPTGSIETVGRLGVARDQNLQVTTYGLFGAMGRGTERVATTTRSIASQVWGLLTNRVSPKELGGPIFIGQIAGQVARAGLADFLTFMALFSINLAILNMLPIPVLDGGQFMVLVAEGIRGKPLDLQLRMRLTQVGLFLLLGIMVYVMTADVLRWLDLL